MALPQVNLTIIEEPDRRADGIYLIGPGQIFSFPFDITVDEQLRIPINQCGSGPDVLNFNIRAWVSIDVNATELFFRFHPGSGGIVHIFHDENLNPPPVPQKGPQFESGFAASPAQLIDILVPLAVNSYHYNVINMSNRDNCFQIGFQGPNPVC